MSAEGGRHVGLGLEGRTALVVGATQGLGRASALRFAQEGVKVALVARTPETLEQVAKLAQDHGADAATWAADFVDTEQVRRVVGEVRERFGSIDILLNSVGVCEMADDALAADDDMWQRAFDSCVMVAVRSCREVVPVMREQGRGVIINIAANSIRHWIPALAHYSSQKIALAHFTKNLSKQCALEGKGIRVNAIMPGYIHSEQVEDILQNIMDADGVDRAGAFHKLNFEILDNANYALRMGDPEEYANVVAFLASDQASYVNGAWLNVDGGSAF